MSGGLQIECWRHRPYTSDMKIIGSLPRDEVVADPAEALRRGRVLDQMLNSARPPRPRGVTRGSHAMFQAMDEQRMIAIARALNQR